MTTAQNLFKDNEIDGLSAPMHLLQHSAEEIAGLKFFGSPYIGLTPRRQAVTQDNLLRYEGFSRDSQRLMELYADIPSGLDVLITHSPPLGILFVNAAAVNGDQSVIKQGGHYVMKEGFLPWVIDIKVTP